MVSKVQQGSPAPYAAAYLQTLIGIRKARRNTAPAVFSTFSSLFNLSLITHYLCCCARAGQTGGAFGLALIFLVLFASRQKERKAKKVGKLSSKYLSNNTYFIITPKGRIAVANNITD
jgi:hypothetical protein